MKSISLLTATCIVIANMVGTAIFTSLGFQVGSLPTGFSLMALWLVGGICALCGAVAYAELGAALPRSGGEYHFLGTIYHPAVGFLAGWVSATVGFAAPVAAAAIAFGRYLADPQSGPAGHLPAISLLHGHTLSPATYLALLIVVLVTLFLLRDVRLGSVFQNASTLLKVGLVVVIIAAGFWVEKTQPISFLPATGDTALILSPAFAVNLFWVMYAYSGWNASTYIVGEVRNPARTIPLSVGLGTIIVMALYLPVNAAFLRTTPLDEMKGQPQVALIAGSHIFGHTGGYLMALFICIGLVSTVSSMMWIGPRVTMAMGEDLRAFRWLGRKSARNLPINAILTQAAIAIVLIVTATFDDVIKYVQFALTLSSALAVAGVIVLRIRQPDLPRPYRTWGYPLTPIVFLAISAWMLWHMLADKDTRDPSLLGLVTIALGLVVYYLSPKNPTPSPAPPAS
ncbi:amino acid permease-associated region [Chthoniobacter flavus Ellin428]|uniref:Amino acid permease-associated region n=1 Tax=Chthoniobacter flavus Ellin428 TaxID=497964 RepID=B4D4L3_9BACT|nr:amino acid permease [Chthoniobacter flavus]EDY18466.1 amino acid permease-associated region [Chthoniobacter flavus Ellin428]